MIPQFTHPWVLLLALLIPPLVWWWLRQRRAALRYPAVGWLTGLPAGRGAWARWGGALLRGVALLLLVFALAGPRWPDLRTRIPTEGIAIVMVTDVSGSMAEPDFDWQGQPITRLDAVKKAFRLFVEGGDADEGRHFEGRPDDLVGLVTFATRPECPCPLTLSHGVLLRMLDVEMPKQVPGESQTNISDAIALALDRLEAGGPRRKVLILLSDGEHNETHPRSGWSLPQAAHLARALGRPIYTIDAGGAGPSAAENPTPTSAETRAKAARDLQMLAQVTGGRYFQASDTPALLDVCREIDQLERQTIQSFQYRRYFEGFTGFALASFVVLVMIGLLELTMWRKVP